MSDKISIFPIAFNAGQGKPGVEKGPQFLLDAGIINQLEELNYTIKDKEQIKPMYMEDVKPESDPELGVIKNPKFVGNVCKKIYELTSEVLKKKEKVLTIGGDHSIGLGTVLGSLAAYPNIGIIWVDAHADINPPHQSSSGNLHGCPLSFAIGISEPTPGFEWIEKVQKLKPEQIVYIALRDVDIPEKKILKENKIKAFSMHEVDKYGIGNVCEMALEYLNKNGERPIHLSFDVDAMDPSVVAATGTPVRGGLTFREGHYICEAIHLTNKLVAMDLVEVNPDLSNSHVEKNETVKVGCSLIRAAFGETLL